LDPENRSFIGGETNQMDRTTAGWAYRGPVFIALFSSFITLQQQSIPQFVV